MHDTLQTIFTGILAAGFLLQSICVLGLYRSFRKLAARTDSIGKDLLHKVEVISGKVDEAVTTIKEIGKGVKPITGKLSDTTDIIHRRVTEVDAFLAETTTTARMEILKVQARIDSFARKAEEMLESLQNSILAPINEINAIARGIRVGLDVLFRRRRYPATTSPHDEEMFI